MSGAVGVERIFPVNLPFYKVEISKKGAVRRKQEFHFRQLTGKKAKIKDKRR
jgi:large subunit ribosomal protein L19